MQRSALAARIAAQAKPLVVDALAQVNRWRADLAAAPVAAAAASAPARAQGAPKRASSDDVLAYVFHRFKEQGPAALLYINGLNYANDGSATVAPTSSRAGEVARRAAARAGVPFYDTGRYLIDSVARTHQPPYGFDNSLRPGGHLNELGQAAVAQALVHAIHDAAGPLGVECARP